MKFRTFYDLLLFKTKANIASENSKYYLSYVWWVIEPVFTMVALYIVFNNFLSRGIPNYATFLLIGVTIWNWFNNCISHSIDSIVNNQSLMNQINIPKIFFPLESILWVSFKSLIVFLLLIIFIVIYSSSISWYWLYLPVLLLIQFAFTIGISILSAALIPFFQDLSMIINTGMRLLFFASGIFFDIDKVASEKYQTILYLNPMAGLIQNYRKILIYNHNPDWHYLIFLSLACLVLLFFSVYFTMKNDHQYPSLCLK